MKPESPKTAVAVDPRQLLMEHMEAIAKKRAVHEEIVAQHRRLQALFKAEAEAQAKMEGIRRRDAQELAAQLVNETVPHITGDHWEQSAAELELSRARREADAARACEPAVTDRLAESSRQIDALEWRKALLVAGVLIAEGETLAAEINAEAKRLRPKYARLWGLRRYVGNTEAIRRKQDAIPLPTHPDHISPDGAELFHAEEAWCAYAAKLPINPDAKFKE